MTNKAKNILIIGGVAAGATAAARMRRLDETANITILEKGKYVSFANCGLPYFISRDIQRRTSLLLQTPEGFYSRYRVNVEVNTEAIEIKRLEKIVVDAYSRRREGISIRFIAACARRFASCADTSGSSQRTCLQIVDDTRYGSYPHIHRREYTFFAVIVGGGFIGLEMAEALHVRGMDVTIVEAVSQVMVSMDAEFGAMIQCGLERHGVHVITRAGVSEVNTKSVLLNNGLKLDADMVLLSIGVRPELTLAKMAGLVIGASGGLVVNDTMQTNDPNIYAAGDMVEIINKIHRKKVRIPLAGPANRQGRIAATNMYGTRMVYPGALGTSVVKLFDATAASTGLSEKAAREAGFDVGVSYVFKDNHVTYFPGSAPLAVKIVYDKQTGRLLGGQAYGQNGVEKRIDVLTTALHGSMTLEDLSELDLAYAPPFNSANDPVNLAAFIGLNNISGFSLSKTPSETSDELHRHGGIILDVRTMGEQAKDRWKAHFIFPPMK